MTHPALPADLQLGYVHLTVADLPRALTFYQHALGLKVHRWAGPHAYLGVGGPDLIALTEQRGAVRVRRTTGLYHFALLTPSRPALAQSIQHLAETRTPVSGAADHLVSEALYLPDADGNGIELYRDRPRAEWRDAAGNFRMDTLPLDINGVLDTAPAEPWTGMAPGTVLGHLHLHVRDIAEARAFYLGVLGFNLMLEMDNALFISAGGYHHHLGLNTWGTLGAPPAPEGAVGLRYFTLHLPAQADVDAVVGRARAVGAMVEAHPAGWLVRDPSHNALVFTAGRRSA